MFLSRPVVFLQGSVENAVEVALEASCGKKKWRSFRCEKSSAWVKERASGPIHSNIWKAFFASLFERALELDVCTIFGGVERLDGSMSHHSIFCAL